MKHAVVATLSLAFIVNVAAAGAAEIKALIQLPAQHVVEELAPQFEKSTGHKLNVTYSGSVDTRKRMAANEVFDLIIASRPDVDTFAKDGKFAAASVIDLMQSKLGLAVKKGAAKPELTQGGIKEAFLAARSIGYSTGSSGDFLQKTLFPKLGVAEQVKDKLKQVPSGASVGTLLASGEAEIGVQQASELINYKGIDFVGQLPEDMQLTTIYAGAVSTKSEQAQAGQAFLRMLASAEAAHAIKEAGLTAAK